MNTDISEKGLETIIMRHMTGGDGLTLASGAATDKPDASGSGYFAGCPKDYDRAHALDVPHLFTFLRATQPEAFNKLAIADGGDSKDINRLKFLASRGTRSAPLPHPAILVLAERGRTQLQTPRASGRRLIFPVSRAGLPRFAFLSSSTEPMDYGSGTWLRRPIPSDPRWALF